MSESNERTVLVAGVTGTQGGAVARRLLHDGWRVRGVTRRPDGDAAAALKAAGAEIVAGDLTDAASLAPALDGVYGVFAMATPFEKGEASEVAQGKTLGDAAKAAGVQHYVYSSVGGAERHTGIPHFESKAEIERHLRELDLPLTILRPVYFMENLVRWGTQRGEHGLYIPMPLSPDRTLPMVAVRDIAGFVALAFAQRAEFLGRELELAGDELTIPEAAALLAESAGEPVTYVQIPWEAARSQSEDIYLMFDWFERAGYEPDFARLRSLYPELTSFREWLASGAAQGLPKAA